MSATAEENSEKWNSGQNGIGKAKSPEDFPAVTTASSQNS